MEPLLARTSLYVTTPQLRSRSGVPFEVNRIYYIILHYIRVYIYIYIYMARWRV